MAGQNRLMQWCRVGVASFGIVSVWILAGIEQQQYDIQVPMLRR